MSNQHVKFKMVNLFRTNPTLDYSSSNLFHWTAQMIGKFMGESLGIKESLIWAAEGMSCGGIRKYIVCWGSGLICRVM